MLKFELVENILDFRGKVVCLEKRLLVFSRPLWDFLCVSL
jgi:hypothetical protein